MLRRLVVVFCVFLSPRTADAVLVGANVTATRLDHQTVRLAVENVAVSTDADLHDLFQIPRTSPFGDPVYLGPYGSPWSVLGGSFGTPFDISPDAELLEPGEVLGLGTAYAFSIASPPHLGFVVLNFFAAQDFFYEYPLPDGSVARGLTGSLSGSLRLAGEIPVRVDETVTFAPVPEPASWCLWASITVVPALLMLRTRRRGLARTCMLFPRQGL